MLIVTFLSITALNNDLVSDVYIGEDKKVHVVKGGADTGLNFSGFPENLRFYVTRDSQYILSFKISGKTTLTFSLNNKYSDGNAGYYPSMDYLDIYDGQPTTNDYGNLTAGMNKVTTLSKNGMTFVDASSYLALCKSGYITLSAYVSSANAATCFVKDIMLK